MVRALSSQKPALLLISLAEGYHANRYYQHITGGCYVVCPIGVSSRYSTSSGILNTNHPYRPRIQGTKRSAILFKYNVASGQT